MQKRRLGNTDLELTTVGLGTWAMGHVAALYFREGKRLTPAELRARYRRLRRRPRRGLGAPVEGDGEG